MAEDCIFCKIAQGESPAEVEYEDPQVIGFWDIKPKTPVHILVIPKKHLSSIEALGPEDSPILGKMFEAAKAIARKKKLTQDGYRLVINFGPNAGMGVEHLHLHLLGGKQLGEIS